MNRLLVSLLITFGLVVAADRVSLALTERAVATQLELSGSLSTRPDVSIRGLPFLTQAIAGEYGDVELSASQVTAGGARLSQLEVSLRGVHVPLGDALSGAVDAVPVDRLRATVVMSYADITRQLRDRRLTVSPAGDQLRVTGSVQVLGRTIAASAVSTVALKGSSVVVTAKRFEVGNGMASRAVTAALAGRFDFVIRLGTLPYGLKLTGLDVQPRGVVATAAATDVTLRRHAA
ncbi:MAG: DUF2993 domain-containing protein [Frankiaceae bacterium]|nr:DUF2993 domain-containing protein [Frankiaceae bacterium]